MCNNVYVYFAKKPVRLHIVTHKKKITHALFIQKLQLVHVYMAFLYAILNLLYVLNDNKDSTKTSLGIREWFWGEYKNCRKLQNWRPLCRRIVLNLGIEVVSHVGPRARARAVGLGL